MDFGRRKRCRNGKPAPPKRGRLPNYPAGLEAPRSGRHGPAPPAAGAGGASSQNHHPLRLLLQRRSGGGPGPGGQLFPAETLRAERPAGADAGGDRRPRQGGGSRREFEKHGDCRHP